MKYMWIIIIWDEEKRYPFVEVYAKESNARDRYDYWLKLEFSPVIVTVPVPDWKEK